MGLKTKNLDKLVKENYNVFEYMEITTLEQLKNYIKNNKLFTIRFDRGRNIENLPFYIYSKDINIEEIIDEANKLNCTLLVSNGLVHDKDLLFNFVIELDKNNNFILELCDKKIPLRKMYNEKTTIIKGNIFEDYRDYTFINRRSNKYNSKQIYKILELVLKNNIKYHYIEGTYYDKKVGMLKDEYIIWQTSNKTK